jgi:hypothetical protein
LNIQSYQLFTKLRIFYLFKPYRIEKSYKVFSNDSLNSATN